MSSAPPPPGALGSDATTADELALRRLVDAYAFAVDHRDAAALAEVFDDDGVLCVHDGLERPPRHCYHGRGEIIDVIERISRYDLTMHLVTSTRVAVDGARATGEVLCVAHHVSTGAQGPEDRVLHITYLDDYALGPDRVWRIARRGVHTRFVRTVPVEVTP